MFKKRIERRQQKFPIKLPLFITTGFFWLLFFMLVFLVDPQSVADFIIKGSYFLFYFLLFLALFFSTCLFTQPPRKAFFVALVVSIFLFLKMHGLGSVFNLIVLMLFFFFLELLFSRKE